MNWLLIVALVGTNGLWILLLGTGRLRWYWPRPAMPTEGVCLVTREEVVPESGLITFGRATCN